MTDRTHDLVTALHSTQGRADLTMAHRLRLLGAAVTQPVRPAPAALTPEMEVMCQIIDAHQDPLRMLRGCLGDTMTAAVLLRAAGCNPYTRMHQHHMWGHLTVISMQPTWGPMIAQTPAGDEFRWSPPSPKSISRARGEYRGNRPTRSWRDYNQGNCGVLLSEIRRVAPALTAVWEAEAKASPAPARGVSLWEPEPAIPAPAPARVTSVRLSDLM